MEQVVAHKEPSFVVKRTAPTDYEVWARIAAVYARQIWEENVEQADFERLAQQRHAKAPHEILQMVGFSISRSVPSDLSEVNWPAIACMTDNQFALVFSHTGDDLLVFNPFGTGNPERVNLKSFCTFFDGTVITATPPILPEVLSENLDGFLPSWLVGSLEGFSRVIPSVLLGSLVANILALAIALFALQVYDRVIPHHTYSTLIVLTIGVVIAIALELILKLARAKLVEVAGHQMDRQVLAKIIPSVMQRPLGGASSSSNYVVETIRGYANVREFVSVGLVSFIIDLPFFFLFLALVWFVGGPLVLVLIVGGSLILLPGLLSQFRVRKLNSTIIDTATSTATDLIDAAYQLESLRACGADTRLAARWLSTEIQQGHRFGRLKMINVASTLTVQGIQQCTYVMTIVFGTLLVFSGEITVGAIIAVSILSNRALMPLMQVSTLLSRWTSAKQSINNLTVLIAATDKPKKKLTQIRKPLLIGNYVLKNVQFSYGDMPAVDIRGLCLPSGQVTALVGENGSGKTTLLKLLSGFSAPDNGILSLDNVKMCQIAPDDLERGICYVPQSHRLFKGTLRQNLSYREADHDDEALLQALDFAGLRDFVNCHPKGLGLEIDDGGGGLSVGQTQRVAWAQVFLRDPNVLLMDEPTSALAPDFERLLLTNLSKWVGGRSVVIATHRLPVLKICDRVIVMKSGRPVMDGPVDDVVAQLQARRENDQLVKQN